MAWKNNRALDRSNMKLSNVFSSHGSLDSICGYICPRGIPSDFVISGGVEEDDRYQPIYPLLDTIIGRLPIIILHKGNIHIEAMAAETWRNACEDLSDAPPLWLCNEASMSFEPFFDMTEMQIVSTCRQLAAKLNYSVTPRFERVVRAHLNILKELKIPYSLSGLYYLCQFYDMGEFYNNIMSLPCDETYARRIWADLGADDENGNGQFDLFRAVINNLAHDAEKCGWTADNTVCESNCITAVKNQALFTLPVNEMYSTLILTYLAEELKILGNQPFFLLIDGIKIRDDNFLEYISSPTTGSYIGLISENVVDQVGNDEAAFFRFAERINCFVLFKHSTGKTAETLSEVLGRYDYTKVEASQGVSRGFFHFIPRDRHEDVRYSTENRFRVMPEEFIGLRAGQVIVFDTSTDQIIHYN